MAYMNQEKKAVLAPGIKAVLDKYNVKGTIAVRNFSTLVVNIKSSPIDFADSRTPNRDGSPLRDVSGGITVNPYWYREQYTGTALAFLTELLAAMQKGNHDRSDTRSDHFDVGWYVNVNVGAWNKPYTVEG
jgi:hypothetical protein